MLTRVETIRRLFRNGAAPGCALDARDMSTVKRDKNGKFAKSASASSGAASAKRPAPQDVNAQAYAAAKGKAAENAAKPKKAAPKKPAASKEKAPASAKTEKPKAVRTRSKTDAHVKEREKHLAKQAKAEAKSDKPKASATTPEKPKKAAPKKPTEKAEAKPKAEPTAKAKTESKPSNPSAKSKKPAGTAKSENSTPVRIPKDETGWKSYLNDRIKQVDDALHKLTMGEMSKEDGEKLLSALKQDHRNSLKAHKDGVIETYKPHGRPISGSFDILEGRMESAVERRAGTGGGIAALLKSMKENSEK
jgi:hypothetical protein